VGASSISSNSSNSNSSRDQQQQQQAAVSVQHVSGKGCLLSLLLCPHMNTKAFYDALAVNKGPSLGTNFTLVCPYTLLAHYTELDWAADFGVSAHLIRVSVGAEPIETLLALFEAALEKAAAVAGGGSAKEDDASTLNSSSSNDEGGGKSRL